MGGSGRRIDARGGGQLRVESRHKMLNHMVMQPNKALQLTANPLRGLSAAELGRYVA